MPFPTSFLRLIPEKALAVASIRRSLQVLRRPESLVSVPDEGVSRVQSLWWVTSFSRNAEFGDPFGAPQEVAFHRSLLVQFREALLQRLFDPGQNWGGLPRRVFIDRGPSGAAWTSSWLRRRRGHCIGFRITSWERRHEPLSPLRQV